jgi:hypothetical protein
MQTKNKCCGKPLDAVQFWVRKQKKNFHHILYGWGIAVAEKKTTKLQKLKRRRMRRRVGLNLMKHERLVTLSAITDNYCSHCNRFYYDDNSDDQDWMNSLTSKHWFHDSCAWKLRDWKRCDALKQLNLLRVFKQGQNNDRIGWRLIA